MVAIWPQENGSATPRFVVSGVGTSKVVRRGAGCGCDDHAPVTDDGMLNSIISKRYQTLGQLQRVRLQLTLSKLKGRRDGGQLAVGAPPMHPIVSKCGF